MTEFAKNTRCNVITAMRYRNAQAAIEFLCNAFAFERQAVYAGPDGAIAHAQLTFGNGMIMIGSHPHEGEYGKWVQPPLTRDAVNTHGLYVVVTDADGHHARAKAAGADILRPPTDQDYGGRDYTCRDLEGFVWSFGTYDPWA